MWYKQSEVENIEESEQFRYKPGAKYGVGERVVAAVDRFTRLSNIQKSRTDNSGSMSIYDEMLLGFSCPNEK